MSQGQAVTGSEAFSTKKKNASAGASALNSEKNARSPASESIPVSAPQDPDPGVAKVMERLRNLESLVKELSGQLEVANAAASSAAGGSSGANSPGSSIHDRDADHLRDSSIATKSSSVQKQFGRLVVQDTSRSRYVSSGFWSRVNDEVCQPVVVTSSS